MTAAAADWALVVTVKAPEEQVLAFAAHHLALGAAALWIFFDDPDDPAYARVSRLPGVRAFRCDAAHWARYNGRPARHQNRQARNALRAYRGCTQAWIGHIDIDEFILPDRPMGDILGAIPPAQPVVRMEPFEAMHDPTLPDDIFTARAFRGPLKASRAFLLPSILGPYAHVLPEGMMSHGSGKSFFRTGIPGLTPRLHGASLDGARLPASPIERRAKLLHFHAQNRAGWLSALPFRLRQGAYSERAAMVATLRDAPPEAIAAFYDETQTLTPEKALILRDEARLIETDLRLRDKVSALLASLPATADGGGAA